MVAFETEHIWSSGFTELQQGGVSLTYSCQDMEKGETGLVFRGVSASVCLCLFDGGELMTTADVQDIKFAFAEASEE
jgi:hypothetical protein